MIKHKKQSNKPDSQDSSLVQPSGWNDEHDVTGLLGALLHLAATPMRVPYVNADGAGADFAVSQVAIALVALATVDQFRSAILAAPIDGADLTGNVRAPTPASNDNSRRLATTEYVVAKIDALVGGAPGQLDALYELAAAIDNDPNFSATMTTALRNRLRVDAAQSLSTLQKAQGVANLGLDAVAASGAYSDLSGKPTLGSAAALNYGTSANQLIRLDANAKIPAIDGSQLTNVTPTNSVRYDISQPLTLAQKYQVRLNIGVTVRNHILGLTCANSGVDVVNDIVVIAGEAGSNGSQPHVITLVTALTKQLDATWAPGNNAGGREAGDTLSNKTYHVWLIGRTDTGDADILFSASSSSPVMPSASWDLARLIWSVVRVSNAIVLFTQNGDEGTLQLPYNEVSDTAPSTSTQLKTLSRLPTGIKAKAKMSVWYFCSASASASGQVYISSPLDTQDLTPNGTLFSLAGLLAGGSFSASGIVEAFTDLNARVRVNATYSDAATVLRMTLLGYTHPRGRI